MAGDRSEVLPRSAVGQKLGLSEAIRGAKNGHGRVSAAVSPFFPSLASIGDVWCFVFETTQGVLEDFWYDSHFWGSNLSGPIVRSLNHLIITDYHKKRAGFPFP